MNLRAENRFRKSKSVLPGKFLFFLFCVFFFLSEGVFVFSQSEEQKRTVTVESARSVESEKVIDELTGEEKTVTYLRGNVVISISEGSDVSKISADEIIYDRTREMMEARGNVKYEHSTGSSGGEKFSGESMLFNVKKQQGVFLDGVFEQDPGKEDSDPFIIQSETTGRDSSSTMAFRNGILTTCDEEDPHWSIRASRIWMLPGNEVALLNGILFIGPLPIFYIPFFYYPGDEMIFHPVYGYRNREGFFFQTTTYLYGRKPLPESSSDEDSSLSNFMKSSTLKEQVREGLFLRNTSKDAENVNPDFFKVKVDAYSSLGVLTGLEGSFTPDNSYISSLSFYADAGFSRTLFPIGSEGFYSPYSEDGSRNKDYGWFMGNDLPFRFRTNFSIDINKSPFSLSVSMPLISDPYFKKDFTDRSEDLNWIDFLMNQSELAEGDDDITTETSYTWNISGSVRPDVSFLNPWITSISISSFTGLVSFNSKTNSEVSGELAVYSPERTFFYPEYVKPSIALNVAGTLLSSDTVVQKKQSSVQVDLKNLSNPFGLDDGETSPAEGEAEETSLEEEKGEEAEGGTADDSLPELMAEESRNDEKSGDGNPEDENTGDGNTEDKTSAVASGKKKEALPENFFPSVSMSDKFSSTSLSSGAGRSSYSLKWDFSPSFALENTYETVSWDSPDDIKWDDFSSVFYQVKTPVKLIGDYAWDKNFISISSDLNFYNTVQEHLHLSEAVYSTESSRQNVMLTDYTNSVYSFETDNEVKIHPFHNNPVFHPTSVSWNFIADLFRRDFTGTIDNPDWDVKGIEWDDSFVDTHSASATFGVDAFGYEETFSFTTNLSPQLESYEGNLNLSWFFGSFTANGEYFQQENADETTEWEWEPLKAVLSWKLPLDFTFSQEYTHDMNENEPTTLSFKLAHDYLSVYYTINNAVQYTLKEGEGWVAEGSEPEFKPYAAGFSFSNTSKPLTFNFWKNRVSVSAGLSSSLEFNLRRKTESSFSFSPKIIVSISDFLDFSFQSTSSNSVIARYFSDLLGIEADIPGEKNLFVDLVKSFNFWDMDDRRNSGFKLKTLEMEMKHYLHDWTASLKAVITPELRSDGGNFRYEFSPLIVFSVSWNPVSDIKATVKTEDGEFSVSAAGSSDDDSDSDSD